MNAFQIIFLAVGFFLALISNAAGDAPKILPIKGKTVDGEGHALAGVVVQEYSYRNSGFGRFDLQPGQQTTSDAQGEFALQPGTSAIPQGAAFLIGRKPGFAAAWTQSTGAGGADPRLVLTPPSFLAGKVVDESDKAVGDAQISVAVSYSEISGENSNRSFNYLGDRPARDLFTTKSGPDGRFRIDGFPTNASAALFAVSASKVLKASGPEFFNPDSMPFRAGQDDIRLVMEPAGSIEGKVVAGDAGTLPVAELNVVRNGPGFFAGGRASDRAAADGTFKMEGLASGPYRVQATFGTNALPDWVADSVPVTVESGQVTRDVTMTAVHGGLLEVAVRSSKDSKLITDVGVNVYKDGYQTGLSGGSNDVLVLKLPPGDYQVNAYKQGWQPANSPGTVQAGQTNRVELELTPSRKLAGTVRLPTGQPAANLPVQVVGDYSMQQANQKTGPDGKFELDWNPQRFPGNNSTPCLLVRDAEHNLAVAKDIEDDSEAVDLQLAPAVSFVAKVQCDGKPITNVNAGLMFRTANMGMFLEGIASRTSNPGEVQAVALPLSRQYSLQISAPGYGSKFVELSQQAEEAKRVELDTVELRRADRKISGKLVDAEEKPVSGTMVHINGEGQPNASARTDREGRFSFDVCDGPVRLYANAQRSFANAMAQAGETNVVLQLGERSFGGGGQSKKLRGTVTDSAGKPVAGAEVRVFPMDMPNRTKSDSNGVFTASYVIQPWQRQNGNPWLIVRHRARNLAAGQEILDDSTNVTMQLEAGLTVKGHIFGPDGKPLPNAQVNLIAQTGRMGGQVDDNPANTDAEGAFSFTALPVGLDYNLYANLSGYSQKHQKLEVDWDKNVVELPPLVLRIADREIAGRVVDSKDKPVAGAYVQVSSDDQPQANMQTDSKGRFKFKVCEGPVRMFANGQNGYAQITAQGGDTNVVILLVDQSMRMQNVVRRGAGRGASRSNASALKGKPLPDLTTLGFAADAVSPGKPVLLCLVDVQQRPSRRVARLLNDQEAALREKGVTVLAAQTVPAANDVWDDWKQAYPIHFPITRLAEKSDTTKWASGLDNLPWLILVDKKGVVADEGFAIEDLEAKLEEIK